MSVNGYNLTGFRISRAFSSLSGTDLECPEAAKLYDLILIQAVLHFFEELIENVMYILAVDAKSFVDALDNFGFCQFAVRQIGPSV